jgi:hypothetical protein
MLQSCMDKVSARQHGIIYKTPFTLVAKEGKPTSKDT